MIETIEYKGSIYPKLQAEGFAAQYAFPFAQKFCKGIGFDIGCMKEEWKLPFSIGVDPAFNGYDAMNLPAGLEAGSLANIEFVDYIFSSHCLEHLTDWVAALDYWHTRLKSGANLYLYLPDMSISHYWRPQNNRKHRHYIDPQVMRYYFEDRKDLWKNVFVTSYDLNYSFTCIAEKI